MTTDWPDRDLLAHRAETTPERTGLIDADRDDAFSYRDLDRRVDRWAAALRSVERNETGSRAGRKASRIALLATAQPKTLSVLFAAHRTGSAVVVLNVEQPADRIADQIERTDPEMLVCERTTENFAIEVSGHLTEPVRQSLAIVSVDDAGKSAVDRLDPSARTGTEFDPLTRDDEVLVVFTSGTTGQPKGVRLTAGNLAASATASALRLGVDRSDRWLACLPTYHVGGLAPYVRSTLYGTTTVLQRTFDPEETARTIDEYGVTGVSLVPTMLVRLLDGGWRPPDHLRFVLLGGAPATGELLARCERRDVPVFPTYGLTETASQVATATPEQAFAHDGTVGQPLVNTTVRIVGEDGAVLEQGETGEIVVDGPTVSPGYLDDDRTASAFGDRGLHTGDLGRVDRDGRLWIVGRIDDRITTGGENVHPSTVAAAISDHPDVSDAAVVGVPDPEWGQRVAALVVASRETTFRDALLDHCRERLATYEIPKTVTFTDSLPRTPSGTVDRDAVRKRLRQRE